MPTAQPPLTTQQRAALDARDRSVSLAAGAGCGKTFVLTERFITHLDPAGADEAAAVDQLVAITFTDAAAREMRDRIRRRCFQRLQTARDDAEAAAWQRLMRSMDAARISTIHSFCTALLRTHAVEAGLDPQFEVLDAPAAELLRLEAIDDRLRALLIDRNDDVLNLAAQLGLDRLRTNLANFSGPENAAAIARWRDATPDELVAVWLQFFQEKAAPRAAAELLGAAEMRELKQLADPALAGSDKLRGHLARLADALDQAGAGGPPPVALPPAALPRVAILDELRSLAMVKGVCSEKDWRDVADYARYRDVCKAVRDLIDGNLLKKSLDADASREAAALGLALVRLAGDVSDSLDAAKARRNQLEFDDLLVRAHRLLTEAAHDAIRQQAARRTRLMMVDEFQDTNPLQVAIIQAFCGEGWRERGLFTVGDFKQSIYRFNGAEPSVSTRLRSDLPPHGRLSLTTNFRSQPAILDFVNAVFVDAFDDYEPLVPARPQTTSTPAVEFLWSPGPNAEGDGSGWHAQRSAAGRGEPETGATTPVEDAERATPSVRKSKRPKRGATGDARAEEARWIARRLVQLVESLEPLVVEDVDGQPTGRPLRSGDVAILLRSLGDAQVYEEALRDAGLDYYLAGGHAFYSQQEIFDVLNLLRAVASTVDEIALAGALRSPLFALADETLFWLVDEHKSLNAALAAEELPPQLAPDEAAKVRRAAATIERLRVEKDRLLVAELLALALELTGYDATLLAEFLGPRKAANVEKLVEQARALDRHSPGDLPGFIVQLSEFVERAPKEALAATQSAGGDVVRIMTIHYAKGLEFPLVVLPDLERRRRGGDDRPVLDLQLGPLVKIPESEGAVGMDLYRRVEDFEDLEERKRLFYVACTRAADYLILSSGIDDLEKPKSDWLQLVDAPVSLATGELRGALPASYGRPAVRVITERPHVDAAPAAVPRGADLHRLVAKTRELAKTTRAGIPRESLPIPADAAARRRFSFSQLTGELAPVVEIPSDADSDVLDDDGPAIAANRLLESSLQTAAFDAGGRDFGALVHAALQHLDFRDPADVPGLCEFLAPQFVDRHPGRAAADAVKLLERFFKTPRAAALAAAPVLRRELEFLLPWPPLSSLCSPPLGGEGLGEGGEQRVHGLPPSARSPVAPVPASSPSPALPTRGREPDGQNRYLHGYIDCLYQDADGRWRLIDYKTNRVAAGEVSQVVGPYELQLLAYRLACEQALGQTVAECTLVLLHAGVEHQYHWDAAAERHGIERITAAINSLTTAAP